METKIVLEVAEAEFSRFTGAMDLDDGAGLAGEDSKSYSENRARIVRAIMRGSLVINDKGEPVYTCQRGEPGAEPVKVTFYEPTGASLMAMDGKKKDHDVGKMYAVMGDICKTPAVTFARMKNADLKVCQSLMVLFLA